MLCHCIFKEALIQFGEVDCFITNLMKCRYSIVTKLFLCWHQSYLTHIHLLWQMDKSLLFLISIYGRSTTSLGWSLVTDASSVFMYTISISTQFLFIGILSYADDYTLLKLIPIKDLRKSATTK